MKKVVLLILLMMSIWSLKAQWSVTPEIGITAVARVDSWNNKWRPGWKLGVGVEYDLNERFALKSGLHYTQRGYSYHMLSPYYSYYSYDYSRPDYAYQSGKINRHFLQIPLMGKYSWDLMDDVKINLAAGPYIAFCIGDNWEWGGFFIGENYGGYGYPYNPDISGSYYGGSGYGNYYSSYGYGGTRSFDWGLSGSAGIEVKNWVVNLGYDLSLGKEAYWDNVAAKYHTVSLSVGYKFRLGK